MATKIAAYKGDGQKVSSNDLARQGQQGIGTRRSGLPGKQFPWVRATFLLPAILYIILFYGYPLAYSIVVSFQRYNLQAMI